MKKFKRNCPDCGKELFYKTKINRDKANKKTSKCAPCGTSGRIFTKEHRKNISLSLRKTIPNEMRKRNCPKCSKEILYKSHYDRKRAEKRNTDCNSCAEKGKVRKPFTDEHKKIFRLSAIKRIKRLTGNCYPNYNSSAIPIILVEAKKYNITDLQHAENGGEFQVCGYFVDGYSPSKNIVIEYYEPFHKNQVERDERRKKEIIKELKCNFIIINETDYIHNEVSA